MPEDSFFALATALMFLLLIVGVLFGGSSASDVTVPLYVLFPS